MSWEQYALFAIFGLYTLAALVAAPYFAKKERQSRSSARREEYRHLLNLMRWSLSTSIFILVVNAAVFLPVALAGSRFFTAFGITLLMGAIILILSWRYLSRLISSFAEETQRQTRPPFQ